MELFVISTSLFYLQTRYKGLCDRNVPVIEISQSPKLEQLGTKEIIEAITEKYPYFPSPYVLFDYHGQLQTIIQFNLRNVYSMVHSLLGNIGLIKPKYLLQREMLTLPCGATIALDWAVDNLDHKSLDDSIVVIKHGLCGSSRSEYVYFQIEKLLAAGFKVVVMNSRGCGGTMLTTNATFVNNNHRDVVYVLDKLKTEYKNVFLLGFSLGAVTSLQYLGIEGSNSPVKASCCICPMWNFHETTDVFYLWSHVLALPLKLYIFTHFSVLKKDSNISFWDILLCRHLDDLDKLSFRHYGFNSVDEYRYHSSPVHTAANISVPTLVISPQDDPVCSVKGTPLYDKRGEGLVIMKTSFGGHLAFPTGTFPFSKSWSESVVVEWFLSLRDSLTNSKTH